MQFSYVMVDFGSGEEELSQVLSIEGTTRGLDLLMVVQMEECDVPMPAKKYSLPYRTYRYGRDADDRSCLSCHAISFDCVKGPAFVISGVETSAFHCVSVANFDMEFFYCIPHERVLGTQPMKYDTLQSKYPTTFLNGNSNKFTG
jgi:hypothetical protein